MKSHTALWMAGVWAAVCSTSLGMGAKVNAEPKATMTAEEKAAMTPEQRAAKMAMKEKMANMRSVHVCPGCEGMAVEAGKCEKCDKDMVAKHVLGSKDGKLLVCDCPADCKCDAKGMVDGKCACGKEVQKLSCKGMNCCPAGCPMVSDKPGKCPCGAELKKAEGMEKKPE